MSASITTSEETLAEGPLAPGARIGSYVIERRLGAGGMGTVYAARHVGLEKPVVIKALSPMLAGQPQAVMRFVREGRAASKIRHPHVVDVTDVGTHDGMPFLVMEYLEGEDLDTRLEKKGRLGDYEIARIMLPVCDAVHAAHELGVIHRDLKPGNIFVARDARKREVPMVLDFGLAKIFDEEQTQPDRMSITRAATFLGTPYYASPEQAQSATSADAKSDQYSLGAIIYELATDKHSVPGGTPYEVLCAIIAGQVVPIRTSRPDISPELEAIVSRAMAHHRDARFASVRELGKALLAIADRATVAQWQPVFDPEGTLELPGTPPALMRKRDERLVVPVTLEPGKTGPLAIPAPEPLRPSPPRAVEAPGQPLEFARPSTPQAAPSIEPVTASAVPPERRSRRGIWLAVAAVILLVATAGVAAAYLALWTEPVAPPVTIAVAPAGAAIELDGVRARTLRVAADGRTHRIRVSAPGHVTQEITLRPGETPPRSISLEVVPAPEPVAQVEPAPQTPAVAEVVPAPPQTPAQPAVTSAPRPRPARPTIAPTPFGGPSIRPAPARPAPSGLVGRGSNNAPIVY
jgi:serine/threonine protein kinase